MKRTPLDDVLTPLMPDLDEKGTDLYSDMISAERAHMASLIQPKNNLRIFFLEAHDIEPLEILSKEDFPPTSKRGRAIIIATPDFDYKLFLSSLESSRNAFLNYLTEKVDQQELLNYKGGKPKSGVRTTALPAVIEFNAEKITYSYNEAYKASSVTKGEIAELISIKKSKLLKSLENAEKKYQHKRKQDFNKRFNALYKQEDEFEKLPSNIIARVSSGHGLSLRATNATPDQPAINFKIKNITIIFSDNPNQVTLKTAHTHERPSIYGECLLEIDELNLKIYGNHP